MLNQNVGYILVFIACLLFFNPKSVQSQHAIWDGFNIEVGTEFNVMIILGKNDMNQEFVRADSEFDLQPKIAINYEINPGEQFSLLAFASYTNKGRRQYVSADIFNQQEGYTIHSDIPTVSLGTNLYHEIFNNLYFGPSVALNFHMEGNKGFDYRVPVATENFTVDGGLTLKYDINPSLYLSAESMIGLTNFYDKYEFRPRRYPDVEISTMRLMYTNVTVGLAL